MGRAMVLAGALALGVGVADAGASSSYRVEAGGGTMGVEAGVASRVSPRVGWRATANYLTFSFDSTISYVDYEMTPEFKAAAFYLDFYPFAGNLRLSGGVQFGDNVIDLEGRPRQDLLDGLPANLTALAADVRLDGEVGFRSVAPYLGLGWSTGRDRGWGVSFDLGVYFLGPPTVDRLEVIHPLAAHPVVQSYLDEERAKIEDDLEPFQYYPVASLKLSYTF